MVEHFAKVRYIAAILLHSCFTWQIVVLHFFQPATICCEFLTSDSVNLQNVHQPSIVLFEKNKIFPVHVPLINISNLKGRKKEIKPFDMLAYDKKLAGLILRWV